jgi:ABC-type antimicrobial peptide transport system permease subunit
VRARELALRLAIGAGRPRVIRQLIAESVLISVVGGAVGLGVAYAGVTMFRQIQIPTDLPIVLSFQLDRRALLVSVVVALVSAVFFGLAPAIRSTRADFAGQPLNNVRTAFLLVTSVVLVVTLFAAYVPARRASRVNPTDALRCE